MIFASKDIKWDLISYFIKVLFGFQIPREVPHPNTNEPIDLKNPADVIIYIVLPLFFFILIYFLGRKMENKN